MLKLFIAVLFAMCCALLATPSISSETARQDDTFFAEVEKLLREYYPQAECTIKNGRFECRFNTRTFLIHHALKTGEWQDACPQEGPNRGGILCTITREGGPWNGAAMVPQTFEYRYFTSLLMAPYNKGQDKHLVAHLNYPDNVKRQLIERYSKLITSFAVLESHDSSPVGGQSNK